MCGGPVFIHPNGSSAARGTSGKAGWRGRGARADAVNRMTRRGALGWRALYAERFARCSARSARFSYSSAILSIASFEGTSLRSAILRASSARCRQCSGSLKTDAGAWAFIRLLAERGHNVPGVGERRTAEEPDHRHRRVLRARRERPRCCRTTEQCDEGTPSHSITSLAAETKSGGSASPSAWAARRLTMKSNCDEALMGRSAGLAPRRMRST